MRIVSSKSGVTRMVIIALVVIIVVGGIVAAYITLRPSTSSSSTHTVDWTMMANYQRDFWNITMTNPYTVTLNDSMTVSSGNQYLGVWAHNPAGTIIWEVEFKNSTYFYYQTLISGGRHDSGYLGCADGNVQVTVNSAKITFVGTSSFTSNQTFENLGQIATINGDGAFNGGKLNIEVQ
jgi:hypothetical protein